MNRNAKTRSGLATAVMLSLGALALFLAPETVTQRIRLELFGVLRPGIATGQAAGDRVRLVWNRWQQRHPDSARIAQLEREVTIWQQRAREQTAIAATRQQQLDRSQSLGTAPWPVASSEPLLQPRLFQARLLSPISLLGQQQEPLLDAGLTAGLKPQSLVVAANEMTVAGENRSVSGENRHAIWLDQGSDSQLSTGQPVFAGRCVVGRLQDVGRYVSQVQPVTAADYRGLAQLIRRGENGFAFGATGILAGTGQSHCELQHVAATEAVSVGDEVYTAGGDTAAGQPMFYGRVIQAELAADGQQWHIRVAPAVNPSELRTVVILGEQVNPLRTVAN